MTDDLVERVEAVIARQMMKTVPYDPGDRMYLSVARAAIAVVLEEAAKVCDPKGDCSEMDAYGKAYAAAIRALAEKSK